MATSFTHPSGISLLSRVCDIFKNREIVQRKDRHTIFLCGGPVKLYSRSIRYRFFKYSKSKLPNFRIFLSEDVTKDLSISSIEPDFINLADFETLVADVSDCIVLFPESSGSIAELGFFTNNKKAIKKLLVINDMDRQSDSFINIGLIDRINSKSDFRQTILLNYLDPNLNMIRQRLNSRLTKSSKKFEFKQYNYLDTKQIFYIVFQIIYMFRALKLDDIFHCLTYIFGRPQKKIVQYLISILIAAKYIQRKGINLEYLIPSPKVEPFLRFRKDDVHLIQAAVINFYRKHQFEAFQILSS